MASQFPTLTFDQAKIALDEVIAAFEEPEAKAKVSTHATLTLTLVSRKEKHRQSALPSSSVTRNQHCPV
jgi:hypothetical protein